MRTLGLALIMCGCLTLVACGDDDDGAKNGDGGTSGKGGSSAGKGGSSAGSSAAGKGGGGAFDPEECSPMMEMVDMLPPGCTQAEIDDYSDCITESCEPTLEKCYGPDYKDGTFSGACKQQLECASEDCACDDVMCLAACPGADACTQCFLSNGCGTDCKLPKCALEGSLGDAGIDFDKTCDEVLACCATLSAQQKEQCTTAVNMIKSVAGANADLGCSPLFAAFGAGSADAACK